MAEQTSLELGRLESGELGRAGMAVGRDVERWMEKGCWWMRRGGGRWDVGRRRREQSAVIARTW